jgi:hypothetical protein
LFLFQQKKQGIQLSKLRHKLDFRGFKFTRRVEALHITVMRELRKDRTSCETMIG